MRLGLKLGLDTYKPVGGSQGLLDQFSGAAAAYSLRYLTNSYTGDVILVRRSSDNAEEGFTPDEINDGTLTTWTGISDGFVKTQYDQSGNSNHRTQTTTSKQPQIVSSGTLVTNNGKPALLGSGTQGFENVTFGLTYPFSIFQVLSRNANNTAIWIRDISSGDNFQLDSTAANGYTFQVDSAVTLSVPMLNDTTYLSTAIKKGENSFLKLNGVSDTGTSNTSNSTGLRFDFGINFRGYDHELIVYPSDQSANSAAIETAINSYYSIY